MPALDRILQEVRRFVSAAGAEVDSDRVLIDRFARSRDERAFAELVRRYGPMVLGACRRVLRNTSDTDDAFQAVFLVLVRRAAVIRDPDRLGAWLFGVAWRTANKLRTTRRHGAPLPDDIAVPATPGTDWPVELDAAIARLPEKYRTPIVLCHLQGLTATEAADRLGCPAATVTTRLFRARNTLRRRLTSLGIAIPVALTTDSVLHVPSALAAVVSGVASGRSISPAAAQLADGVFRSLLMTKIRWAATAACCFVGIGVLGFRAGGQEPVGPSTPPPAVPARADLPAAPPIQPEAATVKTANFRVTAPSQRIARLIADAAERARKETAIAWLGKELPARTSSCRIRVTLGTESGGATTFNFDTGKVMADMQVQGTLDRLLADVIPHEVTHVVMADHFGKPLPRWADEGIALLSESEEEQNRHTRLCAESADAGNLVHLKVLWVALEYPKEVAAFYAESYWLTKTLVARRDRATFVNFVRLGMSTDWAAAAKDVYRASLDDLEREMLDLLKAERRTARTIDQHKAVAVAMLFAKGTADESGQVTIYVSEPSYEATTSYERREEIVGETKRQYYEPVTSYRFGAQGLTKHTVPRAQLRAVTAAGKPVPEAALLETLKGKLVSIVVTTHADGIEPAFAELLKPGTLILIVPQLPTAPHPSTAALPPGR
jgi:RNA polymerase sigma factor (sigma-70 family)